MPGAKTANLINRRIAGNYIPEDPAEFQRLARGLSPDTELISPEHARVQQTDSIGYRELNMLLNDYCSACALEEICGWNKEVKKAAGMDYPFWLPSWKRVTFPTNGTGITEGETIMCTHYKSEEMVENEIEYAQQPLTRLIEIIKGKIPSPKNL